MKILKGQKVKLKAFPELIEILERNTVFKDEFRYAIGGEIAGKEATVLDDSCLFEVVHGLCFHLPIEAIDSSFSLPPITAMRTDIEIRERIKELEDEIKDIMKTVVGSYRYELVMSAMDKITALKWALNERV